MKQLLITIAALVLVGCGEASIHQAARDGNIEAIKRHLEAGTDVNAKTVSRFTPLHFAAAFGHKEVAELLIDEDADVNAKDDKHKFTPLHHASIKGHKENVQLLISRGAYVNAKVALGPKQGLTSLDAANETNHHEIADLLRKHGGKTGEELKAAGN